MKRSRFTEGQVIGILKEGEAGGKTADLARKHGVSEHTIYRWKAKYGGMTVTSVDTSKPATTWTGKTGHHEGSDRDWVVFTS